MIRKNIAVVGGGLAGLTAAYTLCKNSNAEVHLFESNETIGGRVQSRMILGQNVDFGGFLIYPWYTEGHKLFDELGISELLVKTPLSDIYYVLDDGGIAVKECDIELPIGDGLELWLKSFIKILQTSSVSEPDLTLFEGKTISEYLRSTLDITGPAGAYEKYFDTVSQGYCYGPVTQMKTAFMAPIVRQMTFHGDVRTTSFFPEGSKTLTDRLAQEIIALGGSIHYNTPITNINKLQLQSNDQAFSLDAIIFAQTASKDLYESIMPDVALDCWYTHFVTVAVKLTETPIIENATEWGAIFYAPDIANPHQAVSIINTASLYGPDLHSCVLLNILLRDTKNSQMSTNEVREVVHSELVRLFPNIHDEEILDFIHWKQTMPVAQEAFVQAVRDAHGNNGHYFAGDFLGAPSIETAIATGRKAANDVLADLFHSSTNGSV